ncbi:MAG: type II toxin-antitoxin system VapC family toxin [Dehalococcoidia bacterium]
MPLRVCVDASLAIKLVVRETFSDRALDLWQNWIESGVEPIAPPIFPFEVSSVIRNKYVRNELTAEEAERAFNLFTRLKFIVLTSETLLKEAWDMAKELGLPTLYDTAYLALAKLCNCEFWTADEVLINSLQGKFSWVKWIGG